MKWYSPTPLPLAVVFAFAACSGAIAEKSPPAQDGGVVSPSSGLDVHAAVASATLGDEGCAGPAGARLSGSSGICAAPMSQDASLTTVPCDVGCRPSTIQIQFTAGTGKTPARVEVADVRLIDSAGTAIQHLSASNPQVWDVATGSYQAWDQMVLPSSELAVGYTLSSPSWSTFGQSYSATYRIEVTLRIDGIALVLQSDPLSREPIVAT